jgi:hypothetical protein
MTQLSQRALASCVVLFAFVTILFISYAHQPPYEPTIQIDDVVNEETAFLISDSAVSLKAQTVANNFTALGPVKRKNIAISSVFGFHFDVYMALAWTLDSVRAKTTGIRLRVFADTFQHGFEDVARELGIYRSERYAADQLLPALRSADGDAIDLLILGTCEIEYVFFIEDTSCYSKLLLCSQHA